MLSAVRAECNGSAAEVIPEHRPRRATCRQADSLAIAALEPIAHGLRATGGRRAGLARSGLTDYLHGLLAGQDVRVDDQVVVGWGFAVHAVEAL